MEIQRETICKSSLRSFFKALFAFAGVSAGLFILIIGIALLINLSDETTTTLKVLPNDEGKKESLKSSGPVLLRIDINDVIGLGGIKSDSIELQLFDSRRGKLDNRVKGILLHMNTPGGGVIEADNIYRALQEYKKKYKIPVYVYVDGLCASGGMYIAAAAEKIYASPVSVIGSVGVYEGPFFNLYELMQKIGIKSLTIKEGKGKDSLSPFNPWEKGEEKPRKEIVDAIYQRFVNILTEARPNLKRENLINEYGAKVFIAAEAQKLGYIDEAGISYNETLRALKKASGIGEKEYYQVVRLVPPKEYFSNLAPFTFFNFFKTIFKPTGKSMQNQPFLYLYNPYG
ncbi:MAG: S49 family peptidase [Simkaniaceae bacterium]